LNVVPELATVRLRPTFSIPTHLESHLVIQRVKASVEAAPVEFTGQFTSHHAMVSIGESKRHFWSPWLNLDVRSNEAGRQVFGRFSPHPSIWTGFMFAYLSLAVLSFFSVIIGVSQQLSSQPAWGYGLIPIWFVIAICLWLVSQAGQKLAHDEMKRLRELLDLSLKMVESD
jgi:hypothetical protein